MGGFIIRIHGGTAALRAGVDRFGLQWRRVDEVAAGALMKPPSQWNLVREAVLGCGLAAETSGLDLQRACGTGLEAAILPGNKIALGTAGNSTPMTDGAAAVLLASEAPDAV